MGKKDINHQIIYRGKVLERFTTGGWGFFQRQKECCGGFWLGRIYEDCFWLELDFPVSLHDGLGFLIEVTRVEQRSDECDANYSPFD
ncbi:hypothetical protein QRZ63_19215 [Citrobacter youngae]|uniref:hypothetical protein n=1 Tax=Citrobacter freundii complex TaxID=1344959 RepID=UPI000651FD50|nr:MULTISPECIES: hypothetical protein [Citrobacter freundii complex]KLV42483.1 hypothetical protein SK32_03398 [Citrobacter sp. MGH100]MDL4458775.1 hypothetical protein [Citrobacter youngae]